jgi:hypothetical protein
MSKDISTKEMSERLTKLLANIEEFHSDIGDTYDDSWNQEQTILCNIFEELLRNAETKGIWLLAKLKK